MTRSLFLFVACAFLATTSLRAEQASKTLDIYWIDSEGGGSTLVVTPCGESVLFDSGNPGDRDSRRIIAAAKAAGLRQIDAFVLTHFHSDHFGGAAEIAQEIPFATIYEREHPTSDPDGKEGSPFLVRFKPYREMGGKRMRLAPGLQLPLRTACDSAARLEIQCIAVDRKRIEPTMAQRAKKNPLAGSVLPQPEDMTDNANSAVFLIKFGDFRFFNGGDLTWNLEADLVAPFNLVGKVDVYQTNHHGLDVSNNPLLLRSLAPHVIVMNNGPLKGGQPLSFAAIRSTPGVEGFYQLHKSHNVPPEINTPDGFIANVTEARPGDRCPANLIKLSVTPDGKSYTISIPVSGHEKTFATKPKP